MTRDTCSGNGAPQLESIFAPTMHSLLSPEQMNNQLAGVRKWKDVRMEWITIVPDNLPIHTVQHNQLRIETLLSFMHIESKVHIFYHSLQTDVKAMLLSWSQVHSQIELHMMDESTVGNVIESSESAVISFFDIERSLYALPNLLQAVAEKESWDVAVFGSRVIVPGTFGSFLVSDQWGTFVKNFSDRETWFSFKDREELRPRAALFWAKTATLREKMREDTVPPLVTHSGIGKWVVTDGTDNARINDYVNSCLISAKEAYRSY